jgi:hypothetical protein
MVHLLEVQHRVLSMNSSMDKFSVGKVTGKYCLPRQEVTTRQRPLCSQQRLPLAFQTHQHLYSNNDEMLFNPQTLIKHLTQKKEKKI